ncbi:MAG: serine acetyltransferase [Oscillospiraceae bacterium]|nr:serine acetyltransferase [Oscillospiraceae bacterium]
MNKPDFIFLHDTVLALEQAEADRPRLRDYCGLREQVERLTDLLITSMFPRHAPRRVSRAESLLQAVELLREALPAVLESGLSPEGIIHSLIASLPEVQRQLLTDLDAAYRGDPAAQSLDEIQICYPAFMAISSYRLAHVLYQAGVPLLPRIMTEYAHRRTGIDIHPGATIGDSFFIDHGTGVVIGETTVIGKNVKLYQHVTLGAKSFAAEPDGSLVKHLKRHPQIGDRVVIYAGATILGGDTFIGDDCVIGGSVWLTHSVPAGKMVLARAAETDASITRDIPEG